MRVDLKYFWLSILLVFLTITSSCGQFGFKQQEDNKKEKIKFNVELKPNLPIQGEKSEIIIRGELEKNWHFYSSDFDPNLGPTVTTIESFPGSTYRFIGKLKSIKPIEKFDSIWGGKIRYFENEFELRQNVLINKVGPIKFIIKGQICLEGEDGYCDRIDKVIEINFSKLLPPKSSDIDIKRNNPVDTSVVIPDGNDTIIQIINNVPKISTNQNIVYSPTKSDDSWWLYILFAIGSGVIALLTPCVYPMVPMTVSLFTKSSKSRGEAIRKALVYGFSIIVIYTLLALIPATLFGVDYANLLSTHWLTNLIFFAVFIVFGISFLGMFELTLPSSFINKIDAQADKSGGYTGIFFMAFTLVLVSFSCTAPFVGTILIESQGSVAIKPVIGMLAYSATFALPFTIFALFPSLLKSLPKSGSWLNTVKVVFGFLELGLALKFLSTADLVYHWGILDRDLFIAIWLVLSVLLGVYLLGGFRLPHDDNAPHISVGRFLFAMLPFVFAVYLIPGLFGAPLKALSGIIPPMSTHDFNILDGQNSGSKENTIKDTGFVKYGDILHLPHGLKGYFDYKEGIEAAKAQNKPIFIDFTGHGCANCRKMEDNVWSDPRVLNLLKNEFIIIALYVDERTEAPESEWIKLDDGRIKKSLGEINHHLEVTKFGNAAQPYYILLDPNTEKGLTPNPLGYEPNVENFVNYLQTGLDNFKKNRTL